jgi:hypothetical protein
MTSIPLEMPVLESQVLVDNPLHDPPTRRLPILLPPNYGESGRSYPVIVGLTGFTGKGIMLLNEDAWQPNLIQRLEYLYAAGLPQWRYVL